MSIRTRLAIAVTLVLLLTLGVLGVVIVRETRATLVAQVDEEVRNVAGRAKGPGKDRSAARPPKPDGYYQVAAEGNESYQGTASRPIARFVYSASGVNLAWEPCGYLDDPKPAPKLPEVPSREIASLSNDIVTVPAEDDSLNYRLLTQIEPDGDIAFTAGPLDDVDAAVARLIRVLLIVGVAALAVAALVSWWLIRRGLRPVDQMVATAAAIAGGDLSRRVPDADPRTELGLLGGALNDMLHQVEGAVGARIASEDRLRRFVADAAHELRTPLTSLRGYAELYRQGAISDQEGVDNAMRRIEGEGARMARLVDDLLLLARLDQQRGLERQPVDLIPLVRDAISDFSAVAPDRPVSETLVAGAVVRGDPIRLRQIIDNLLVNARMHTPPGTPVHVSVTRTADHVALSVADKGPGIALEDQARVFERFWRADPARTRSKGGSGLGLAIVASLVEGHGGTVKVASQPGQGTTFVVRLPLLDAKPAAEPTPARPAPAAPSRGANRRDSPPLPS